jgi:hypothetical protein
MFTVHVPVEADPGLIYTEGYGYGWFIGTVPGGRRVFFHPGDQPGFCSLNAWLPDHDVRLVVLSNERTTRLDPIVRTLIHTALPASPEDRPAAGSPEVRSASPRESLETRTATPPSGP